MCTGHMQIYSNFLSILEFWHRQEPWLAVPCRYEGKTCVPVYLFISFISLDGHLELCDTLLAILNNTILNIRAQIAVQVLLSILLAIYLAVVLLERLIFRILFFLKWWTFRCLTRKKKCKSNLKTDIYMCFFARNVVLSLASSQPHTLILLYI